MTKSIMTDKEWEYINDAIGEGVSNCCGAGVLFERNGVGICADCKEGCGTETEEEHAKWLAEVEEKLSKANA